VVERQDFVGKPHDEVANRMARSGPGSPNDQVVRAEFMLRQTVFMERQAAAAEKTATETARYTKYMFWSVLVLAVSSLVSLLVGVWKQ
jgi:hypothetical protein